MHGPIFPCEYDSFHPYFFMPRTGNEGFQPNNQFSQVKRLQNTARFLGCEFLPCVTHLIRYIRSTSISETNIKHISKGRLITVCQRFGYDFFSTAGQGGGGGQQSQHTLYCWTEKLKLKNVLSAPGQNIKPSPPAV